MINYEEFEKLRQQRILEHKPGILLRLCRFFPLIPISFILLCWIIPLSTLLYEQSNPEITPIIIIFLVLLLMGIIVLIIRIGKKKSYIPKELNQAFKLEIIDHLIKQKYDNNYFYKSNFGIETQVLQRTLIIPDFDEIKTEDYFASKYKNTKFYSSDVHAIRIIKTKNGTSKSTQFKGRVYVIDVNKDVFDDVKIVSNKFSINRKYRFSKFHEINTESIEFNELFKVYSRVESNAFYALKPQYIEKMNTFANSHGKKVSFSFDHGNFYVAINNFNDFFELDLNKPITQENVQHILDELQIPLDLIDLFEADKL